MVKISRPFPYTGDMNSTIDLLSLVNAYTKGQLGLGILIIIGFVSFFSTKAYSTDRAFGFAAFMTLLSAILLRFMDMISDGILFLTIAMFVLAIVFLIRERSVNEFGV